LTGGFAAEIVLAAMKALIATILTLTRIEGTPLLSETKRHAGHRLQGPAFRSAKAKAVRSRAAIERRLTVADPALGRVNRSAIDKSKRTLHDFSLIKIASERTPCHHPRMQP
jgi:hypothetical protein